MPNLIYKMLYHFTKFSGICNIFYLLEIPGDGASKGHWKFQGVIQTWEIPGGGVTFQGAKNFFGGEGGGGDFWLNSKGRANILPVNSKGGFGLKLWQLTTRIIQVKYFSS